MKVEDHDRRVKIRENNYQLFFAKNNPIEFTSPSLSNIFITFLKSEIISFLKNCSKNTSTYVILKYFDLK